MVSGLSGAGSEDPVAGVADTSDGDAECWDTVAGGVVFWTGNGVSGAVVGMGWIGGVGSDGGGWTGVEALMVCGGGGGGNGWSGGCVTGGKAE